MKKEGIESWSQGLNSDDGLMSMLDMIAVITSRLSQEYEQHSSLQAATIVLTELTGWPSIVIDSDGERAAGSREQVDLFPEALLTISGTRPVESDGWIGLSIPSAAHYVLCVHAPGGMNDGVRLMVMGEIAALTGFELRIEDEAMQERNRLWGDLAQEMLSGIDRQRVTAHAAAVGHNLDEPHCVGLIADGRIGLSVDQVQAAIRRAGQEALVATWGLNIALVMDEGTDTDKILQALDQIVPGGRPWMGVSSPKQDGYDLSEAVSEASVALAFGQAAQESRTISYRDLGVFRLFAPDGKWSQLEDFVRETLGPLIEYDRSHGSELVHTLDAYLCRDSSLNHLAESLMIHRSTLVYRLRRIRELLDIDIDDSALRLDLSLAARAVDVLKVTSGGLNGGRTDWMAS